MERLEKVTLKTKVLRGLWNITWFFLVRPFGTRLLCKWRVFILKLWGAKISWDSSVYSSTYIWAPWNLIMEENSGIGPHVIVYNQAKVIIKNEAKVSQYAYLCTAGHDISIINNAETGLIVAPIVICSKAWVGTRAFIGMGVTIGEGAIVGATASVYKDVEPWTVVGGNPAKYIKKRILNNNIDNEE